MSGTTKLARVDEVLRSDSPPRHLYRDRSMRGERRGFLLDRGLLVGAAAVIVVSSLLIGSGLRVIARASTSSMRETGTISSPKLPMLSAISTRSLAFSSGMSTVLMPPRKAASNFSLRPAIGHTRPRSVISPVITETMAVGSRNGDCALRLRFAEKNQAVRTGAVNGRGPSLAACLLILIAHLWCSTAESTSQA